MKPLITITGPDGKPLAAAPYPWPVPFHCSAECGAPVRYGELCAQTSPDLRPLTRAHAACLIGRKGFDSDRRTEAA